MNVAKYMGPIFSLVMCLSMTVVCLYTLFGTKMPLLMPVATGGIAIISGVMVASDVKRVWWPLLTGKPVS
jgi:hypothetical protein